MSATPSLKQVASGLGGRFRGRRRFMTYDVVMALLPGEGAAAGYAAVTAIGPVLRQSGDYAADSREKEGGKRSAKREEAISGRSGENGGGGRSGGRIVRVMARSKGEGPSAIAVRGKEAGEVAGHKLCTAQASPVHFMPVLMR